MTPKHLCILLLALIAVGGVLGQSEDIPIENDNQFPPDNPIESKDDVIEGSGGGTVEEPPIAEPETTPAPELEEVQPAVLLSETITPTDDQPCPNPCVCHYEGGSENFVVDCSRQDLTLFPAPLDPKTTTLNLQNNKLTEIPKEVSSLKNLKVLNAENNLIKDLSLGSVSELPELTVLKLGNNRLIEYPKDLQNSLSLTKLEELDLGGNDMRTELKSEIFTNFVALRKLTIATATPEILQDLCKSLKTTLEIVCTESCSTQVYECVDAPDKLDDDLLDATLPGMIPFEGDDADPTIQNAINDNANSGTEDTLLEQGASTDITATEDNTEDPESELTKESAVPAASGRSLTGPEETTQQKKNSIVVTPEKESNPEEVKVGAATTSTTSGGVDKSVIGMIVAGMVLVVAGITIKKNWSSIRKRFSSSPRPAERAGANANGTTPEEIPLQEKDKSPV